jgi:hypothetical protein
MNRNRRSLQIWAAQLFNHALPALAGNTSLRAWAFALIGISDYLRRMSGDRLAREQRESLTQRLLDGFDNHNRAGWLWFEPILTYANAQIPQALILSGHWTQRPEVLEVGLRSLRWLMEVQTAEAGHFRPIGSEGFYPRGGTRACLDQQPLEAQASVSACLAAYLCTQQESWLREAQRAFQWFLGKNDLGQSVYDPGSGGCYDALHVDRLNLNQGAESTLAFLLALQKMRLAKNLLSTFVRPVAVGEPDADSAGTDALEESLARQVRRSAKAI